MSVFMLLSYCTTDNNYKIWLKILKQIKLTGKRSKVDIHKLEKILISKQQNPITKRGRTEGDAQPS